MMLAGGGFQPLLTAAIMQQFPSLQQFQSQLAHMQQQNNNAAASLAAGRSTPRSSAPTPTRKARVGGSSVKTAKVWKYFDQLPPEEQAAQCQLCRKKIKATNSSTTGMIRHLRSCHGNEYQQLQEARQTSMIMKMVSTSDEKSRTLLQEMGEKVNNNIQTMIPRKQEHQQKSPSSCSSASDTASSIAASLDSSPPFIHHSSMSASSLCLPTLQPLMSGNSGLHSAPSPMSLSLLPAGLPAPKPLMPTQAKIELTEEEEEKPTDLSTKPCTPSIGPTAFSAVTKLHELTEEPRKLYVNTDVDDSKINTQIAMMLLLDGQPPQTVDRTGFRGLLKLLLPTYVMPTSDRFEQKIIPETIAQLREDFSTQFILNNPMANPLFALSGLAAAKAAMENMQLQKPQIDNVVMASIRSAQNISRSFSHSLDVSKREEDSDSASSAESERVPEEERSPTRDAEKQENVVTVLALCRKLSVFFSSRPLDPLSSAPSADCPPDVKQDVAFVVDNMEKINEYLKTNPQSDFFLITDVQKSILCELNDQLQNTPINVDE